MRTCSNADVVRVRAHCWTIHDQAWRQAPSSIRISQSFQLTKKYLKDAKDIVPLADWNLNASSPTQESEGHLDKDSIIPMRCPRLANRP